MHLTKDIETEHEAVTPEGADHALIRQHARRDVKEGELWCGALHACNTRVDRAGERFTKAYLDRFAATLPGKSLLEGHDYGRRSLGRIYKAEVLPEPDGHYLKAYYYLKADSPLVSEIELGIQKDCSIGYHASRRTCDLDGLEWNPYRQGEQYCPHYPLEEYDGKTCTLTYCDTAVHKAEAMEMSFVWHGCQFGAQAVEKAARGAFSDADWQRLARLMAGRQEGKTTMPTIEELTAAIAEQKTAHTAALAEVTKQLDGLKKSAADGDWGRQFLAAEIVRMARPLGMLESYGAVLKALGESPTVAQLLPIWQEVGEKFDERYSQGIAATGGAPNPNDPKPQEKHGFSGLMARLAGGHL